jgi:hypothetical protein
MYVMSQKRRAKAKGSMRRKPSGPMRKSHRRSPQGLK